MAFSHTLVRTVQSARCTVHWSAMRMCYIVSKSMRLPSIRALVKARYQARQLCSRHAADRAAHIPHAGRRRGGSQCRELCVVPPARHCRRHDAGTGAPRPRGRDVATLHRSQAAAVPRYERQRLCGQSCACAVLRRNATPRRVQMQYRKGARQRCNHSSHSDINYDVGLAAAVNTPLAPTMAIARKHCIPPASMAATVDRVDRSRRDAPHFEPTQQQPTRGCDVATHRSQPVAVRTRPSARAHQYAWL